MGDVKDIVPALVSKKTEDWPIEKKIAFRAMILMREEHPEIMKILGQKALSGLQAAMVNAFECAAIELRDEMDWTVLTVLGGLSAEEACERINERLARCASPITQRLKELENEVNSKERST